MIICVEHISIAAAAARWQSWRVASWKSDAYSRLRLCRVDQAMGSVPVRLLSLTSLHAREQANRHG